MTSARRSFACVDVTERIISLTRGMDGALMESSVMPMPSSSTAAYGSLAISPHMPAQMPRSRALWIVRWMSRRTAGLNGL